MSAQDASGIDFSIRHESQQQHFRLLELPAEVLELLTSENPPTLHIKSLENAPDHTAEHNAVFCTPDKTFNLRQNNTSNSLYVTQPSDGPADEIFKPGLDAIAQSHFTLELQPAADPAAAAHIQAILPVYASTGHYQSANSVSKAKLFTDVPASDGECEQAWVNLACFELDDRALRPSASVKIKVWESLLSAATADAIDLTTTRLQESHISTLTDSDSSRWPSELSRAVLRSMSGDGGVDELVLDEKKCARAIGHALLRDRAERSPIAKGAFISAWADLLPEMWRKSAELGALEGSYGLRDGALLFTGEANGASDMAAAGANAPGGAKSALGAKRKWHEKFRASKKA